MTVTLELKPEIEKAAIAYAESLGLPVEQFLVIFLENNLSSNTSPLYKTANDEEWEEALDDLANHTESPALSLEAMGRESIYGERENNQL